MEKVLAEGGKTIRCPHCFAYLQEDKSCADGTYVTCGKCKRKFHYRYRVGAETKRLDAKKAAVSSDFSFYFPWGLLAVGLVASYLLTQSLLGPDFILYYVIVLVVLLLFGNFIFARQKLPQLLLFWGIGLGRFQWGVTHGMRKFNILWHLILLGTGVLIIRLGAGRGGRWSDCRTPGGCSGFGGFWASSCSSSSYSSCSSSSSSCSSGCGGGGGGCGGCGSN